MNEFVPGQRWVSEAESHLGLGTVLEVDQRRVSLAFISSGETRTYARATAPLTRLKFAAGDTVRSDEGWNLKIIRVEEIDGLLVYDGLNDSEQSVSLIETRLDDSIKLNRPLDRLLTGQLDRSQLFELRYQTLLNRRNSRHSNVWGLCGGRTDIIPHQIYIAHEVANRFAPRVLLADEVGLGKTIEAGMIIHRQLLNGLASRVLITVPESLLHQWLVEMLRRFNLKFSIYDEERCVADEESANVENPFDAEQLVLCSTEFLTENQHRHQQLLESEWDLLIVDEAHHLAWEPKQPSKEYKLIEQLTRACPGVLLLTATPEQLGKQSHFARLRLLDSDRFPTLEQFLLEEENYQPIAEAVSLIFENQSLTDEIKSSLTSLLASDEATELLNRFLSASAESIRNEYQSQLIDQLLDRHGTGRVLFRNTRHAIKGFPDRKLHTYPLTLPQQYELLYESIQSQGITDPRLFLCPERLFQQKFQQNMLQWTHVDPRVDWLIEKLQDLKPAKILVITATQVTALDLAETLRQTQGIHAAVFHEGMSIIERDRAAAYFADMENGSQVLICSEIGSEGRNFQFSSHLILFDLPFNPDLLEQRIGRLDRIGQQNTVNIHIPFLNSSPQAQMLAWYHDGLNALEHQCPSGSTIFEKTKDSLIDSFNQLTDKDNFSNLVIATRAMRDDLNQKMHQGKDRLLEYNSCRLSIAQRLCEEIKTQDSSNLLQQYMELAFSCFGVEVEDDVPRTFIIRPGNQLQADVFPGLTDDGLTVTYDRAIALTHENIQYLTWEHPMVIATTEMVLAQENGNANVIAVKMNSVAPGTLLMECIFAMEFPRSGPATRLPPVLSRILLDHHGKDLSNVVSHQQINRSQVSLDKSISRKVVKQQAKVIRQILQTAQNNAERLSVSFLNESREKLLALWKTEAERLTALKTINPNIRQQEIDYVHSQMDGIELSLQNVALQLDSVRVIVTT